MLREMSSNHEPRETALLGQRFYFKEIFKKKKKEFMVQARVAVMAGAQWKCYCFHKSGTKLCHNYVSTHLDGGKALF